MPDADIVGSKSQPGPVPLLKIGELIKTIKIFGDEKTDIARAGQVFNDFINLMADETMAYH